MASPGGRPRPPGRCSTTDYGSTRIPAKRVVAHASSSCLATRVARNAALRRSAAAALRCRSRAKPGQRACAARWCTSAIGSRIPQHRGDRGGGSSLGLLASVGRRRPIREGSGSSSAGYPGSLAASTSTFSMAGGFASRSAGLLHERGRHPAREMGLPPRLVRERVEDAEGARAHPEREPGGRGRLALHHRQPALEEGLDVLLLAGLGLEPYVEGDVDHVRSPFGAPPAYAFGRRVSGATRSAIEGGVAASL